MLIYWIIKQVLFEENCLIKCEIRSLEAETLSDITRSLPEKQVLWMTMVAVVGERLRESSTCVQRLNTLYSENN